jgi:hypothetical protein
MKSIAKERATTQTTFETPTLTHTQGRPLMVKAGGAFVWVPRRDEEAREPLPRSSLLRLISSCPRITFAADALLPHHRKPPAHPPSSSSSLPPDRSSWARFLPVPPPRLIMPPLHSHHQRHPKAPCLLLTPPTPHTPLPRPVPPAQQPSALIIMAMAAAEMQHAGAEQQQQGGEHEVRHGEARRE